MADRYTSFAQLSDQESKDIDYRVCVTERRSPAAIIAPHGGWIEPGTSEVATAIAGKTHSLYRFEGLKPRPHGDLHITSTRFDEPNCLALIERCGIVVSVHGMAGEEEAVLVGGLDARLRDGIRAALDAAGFPSKIVKSGRHAAVCQSNVCNRGRSGKGVQLELSMGLRDMLLERGDPLKTFAESIQEAISRQRSA